MKYHLKLFFLYSLFICITYADSYIVKGVTPTKLYSVNVNNMTGPERTMVGTLQGVIAKTSEEQIYIRPLAGGYDTWLDDLETNYGVERVVVGYPWFLLDHFKDYVNGYILYQMGDGSINSATSLAGILNAVVIEQSVENQAIELGLTLIADMRGVDESWVYANYADQLNPDVVIQQREEFEHTFRDYAILSDAFIFFDGNSSFQDQVLDGLNPNSLMMGWGDAWSGEDVFISIGMVVLDDYENLVKIGDRSAFGNNVSLIAASSPNNSQLKDIPFVQQRYIKNEPITICNDCWLGSQVTVLPNVTIGSHSIIGAGSVVVKNVPPYSVFAGVPAKLIRTLKK